MRRIYVLVMLIRSFPLLLVYHTLTTRTKQLIAKDMARSNDNVGIMRIHEQMLFDKVFRRKFYFRIATESMLKYKLIRWIYKPLESLEISSVSGHIGGGLQIYHGYSTIIYCYSMGENCSVYQNVTIGKGKCIKGIDCPIIGNNVEIYTGAIIVGGVHIGDYARIGAGTVVTKDIPAYATVVSQPMKVIEKTKE